MPSSTENTLPLSPSISEDSLILLAEKGNLEELKNFLETTEDILLFLNTPKYSNHTILQKFSYRKHYEAMALILDKIRSSASLDPDILNNSGWSFALYDATANYNPDRMKVLLKLNSPPFALEEKFYNEINSYLSIAASQGNDDPFKILLNEARKNTNEALKPDLIKALIKSYYFSSSKNSNIPSIILEFVKENNYLNEFFTLKPDVLRNSIVRQLILIKDQSILNNKVKSLDLLISAIGNNIELLQQVVTEKFPEGDTPFVRLANEPNTTALFEKVLISLPNDTVLSLIEEKDTNKSSIFMLLANFGRSGSLKILTDHLISEGIELADKLFIEKNEQGETAFSFAIQHNHQETVKFFLEKAENLLSSQPANTAFIDSFKETYRRHGLLKQLKKNNQSLLSLINTYPKLKNTLKLENDELINIIELLINNIKGKNAVNNLTTLKRWTHFGSTSKLSLLNLCSQWLKNNPITPCNRQIILNLLGSVCEIKRNPLGIFLPASSLELKELLNKHSWAVSAPKHNPFNKNDVFQIKNYQQLENLINKAVAVSNNAPHSPS